MDIRQIKKAALLLNEYIHHCDSNILDDGRFTLNAHLKDGSQKNFKDLQHVIDWVQVQKLRDHLK